MEFDVSKVYSAVTAEQLKVGDKVIVADNLEQLRNKVQSGAQPQKLVAVLEDNCEYRFSVEQDPYALAYLVESRRTLHWADLKPGDIIRKEDVTYMVTAVDSREDAYRHIYAGDLWLCNDGLEEWEKVDECS